MNKHPVTRDLVAWYEQNKRDLPWRNSCNPYHIWLSEVILQQTRVDQGMAYYYHFTEKYPTIKHLASAPESEVMLSWQGLGYYSRARNLHAAAQMVTNQYKGEFPDSYEKIRALKGVGDYTAAAVASIAFGLPHAAIDGNVNRVMTRLFGLEVLPLSPSGKKEIKKVSEALLDPKQPGTYNQAVMELGATVCKPRNPDCEICPIRPYCQAYASGKQHHLPLKGEKTPVKSRYFHFLIYRDAHDRTLVQRREHNDIWKGLYEFPLIETETEVPVHKLRFPHSDNLKLVAQTLGIKHLLTHRELWVNFYHFEGDILPLQDFPNAQPISFSELPGLAFPRAITRYLEQLKT